MPSRPSTSANTKAVAGRRPRSDLSPLRQLSRTEADGVLANLLIHHDNPDMQVFETAGRTGKSYLIEVPGSTSSTAFALDARARVILNGRAIAHRDLQQAGGAFTLQQVMELLGGVSRQRVDQLVKSGRLLAVPGPSNVRCYPTLQFNPDGSLVAGLDDVQSALPTRNPSVVLNFLAHPDPRLGNRPPIELLRAGDVGAVVEAARSHSEPGA